MVTTLNNSIEEFKKEEKSLYIETYETKAGESEEVWLIANTLQVGIEMGGTSCKFGVYFMNAQNKKLLCLKQLPTSQDDAQTTIDQLVKAIQEALQIITDQQTTSISPGTLGIASFGPVCLDQDSPQYGNITMTPKLAWRNYPLYTKLRDALGFSGRSESIFFDTDVNVPALFEFQRLRLLPNPPIKESLCYVTVGTGIGIGLIINGKCVHGMMHPEGGHVKVPLSELEKSQFDDFKGVCPSHGACLEGLCTNVAMKERLKMASVTELPSLADEHPIWDLLAFYLGTFCANLVLTASVERIILGGGVMKRKVLFGKIRQEVRKQLNGYVQKDELTTEAGLEQFIVGSEFGDELGCLSAATASYQLAQ